ALAALAGVLEGWGCHVAAVPHAHGADRAIRERPADLWLFDFHLDDGDTGLELRERLGQWHDARPTLILSADQSETVRRAVLDAGLSLLSKPVKPLALKSVLDRLLASRSAQHATSL
ncbi:MAG: response regulator, partial [Luteimonas sp.]